ETFSDFLADRSRRFADRVAVVGAGQRWTYAELDARAAATATGLARLGVAAGDRVVVQLPNVPELLEVVFALFKLGALPVYALPAHRAGEVSHLCTTTRARALVVADRHGGFDYRTMVEQMRAQGSAPDLVLVAGEAGGFTPLAEARTAQADPSVFARPDP